ncbi:peptide/nickel transport system ATP-binding protein [Saccharothrix carnea]|uniref:Peptide/nickel transport system ATP-binding protein n=1 Tax=Saccharothrix carnea TaxID=1280637 RepID=A0A2P8I505_SACCR|nr:ATP-binding cassette domain-containing protein [Saccharothrix carnea]PSL53557.1 peptide/nickel transport system ATP-binding protein [Saccharothrix carnea]
MTPVVHVEDLRAVAGSRTLVDGVSFALAAGQVLALVGASGSGKTTTGLALLSEHAPGVAVSGRVTVTGRVGFVPQQPSAALNPVRRLGGVFREIAALHPGDRDTVIATALRRARVPAELLRRYPHELSGGQQQRVVLAQALIGDPAVLVADEPTTGQDPITRAEVVDELSSVVAQGVALVLLTHDLDVVRALADEVVVLRSGQVVEAGPTADVLDRPRSAYTAALVAAQPRVTVPEERPAVPPGLETRSLTARHRATTVLHDVDVRVGAGECLAVVGRSGSGKTTLARCVAGLHAGFTGDVLLDGRPLPRSLRRRSRAELAAVQYVFQDARASFDAYRTVLDQVSRTAARLGGVADARAAALVELAVVGLDEATVTRRPAGLSGGELQRAALARALLARPDVLVCDEITSGLDTLTQANLLDQLAALTCTVVLISHDLAVVARLADRVAVLHRGHVVEQGPAGDVLGSPTHPVTIGLLGRSMEGTEERKT